MDKAPYINLDHALRRAFADPRENYGKMLDFSGVMGIGDALSPMDQVTQDELVRQVLENNLDAGKMFILYLCYDTTAAHFHAMAALDMFTEIFCNRSNRYFVKESVARWAERTLGNRLYHPSMLTPLSGWAAQYNVKSQELRYLRFKIFLQLSKILDSALGAAQTLLDDRGIIR